MFLFYFVGDQGYNFANIIFEYKHDAVQIKMRTTLLEIGEDKTKKDEIEIKTNRAQKLVLSDLKQNQAYHLSMRIDNEEVSIEFKTWSNNQSNFRVYNVNCNDYSRNYYDLWEKIKPNDQTILLHLGDQIYGDTVYNKYESHSETEIANNADKILEDYRDLYRKTYSKISQHAIMSKCSNLMMLDDHEVVNDFGPFRKINHSLAQIALRAYYEYQVITYKDVSQVNVMTDPIYWSKIIGQMGLLLLDVRLDRYRWNLHGVFTDGQKDFIKQSLREFKKQCCKTVIVGLARPLYNVCSCYANCGSRCNVGDYDEMSHEYNVEDSNYLLDKLGELSDAEVLILSGDLHQSTYTEFNRRGHPLIRQLVNSPISQAPNSENPWYDRFYKWMKYKISCNCTCCCARHSNWTYSVKNVTNNNNVGCVCIENGQIKSIQTITGKKYKTQYGGT